MLVDDHRPTDDGEMARRTVVGLPGVVKQSDRSLFSSDDFGLVEAASRTLRECFDVSSRTLPGLRDLTRWSEARALIDGGAEGAGKAEVMIFIAFKCTSLPEIADAVSARSTSSWLPLASRPNDLERFDRWSSRFLSDTGLQAALGA
ncbi:hypothetical protein [Polymorphobacter sp. PAMC 29334]|uniref:hypothetical protein n=1 Tax=Polymorphobacter sp. PAMC 29334 TaxID=2862331 RepID=UPI001D023559|nr:hypothetical protein [Polymorphobacter sp. PAMC 29334]